MADLLEAKDPDVERIASELFDYITTTNMFRDSLKFTICEALYEMKAIAQRSARHVPHHQVDWSDE